MSEMKHYVGKLKEVCPGSKETFEEMCHRILLEENVVGTDEIVEDYYYSEWSEVLQENLYDKYIVTVDKNYEKHLFMVSEKKKISDGCDVYNMHKNINGEYEYEVVYYDGGTSFDDAINFAYYEMERK